MAPKVVFPIVLFLFQILLLGLFASGWVNYEDRSGLQTENYPQFQDVHVMIFIGFGFLMTFLQKYGFGAVSYNLLLSAVTIQWATLLNAWIKQRVKKEEHGEGDAAEIILNVESLMTADFTAAAVLITYGAVLGKATRLQLLVITIFECVFFAINETIIMEYLVISDAGGSIVVHLFGAYFGLAVATVLQNHGYGHELESSNYQSDIFSMIGSIFLWVYWPSFNAGLVGNYPNRQNRAIINTYFSLASCVITTFVASALVQKKFKFNMVHIQNATLAGGVAVGTCADLMIKPWGAILVGMIAGVISVGGYTYLTPFMSKTLKIHDTCGVHNLHGLPAVFAGIAGAIASASIDKEDYVSTAKIPTNLTLPPDYPEIYSKTGERSLGKQAGYQFAAVCVSFAFAIAGGIITGIVCRLVDKMEPNGLYNDDEEFEVPANFHSVNGHTELQATVSSKPIVNNDKSV